MFEEKLYDVQNIKGERNMELSQLVKELNKAFSRHPAHIGIILRGSKVKGYSTETSDFDMVVLYDSSKVEDKTEKLYFLDKSKEHGILPMHLNINLKYLKKDFELAVDSEGFGAVIQRIAALTELATGKKVKEYRNAIREEWNELTDNEAAQVKERTLDLLKDKEKYSVKKEKTF